MSRPRVIYLVGPTIHADHAGAIRDDARLLCEAAGFEASTPSPEALKEIEPSEVMAREIYAERASRMRQADAAVVDLTPFRGPHCDPAAAFEAGFLAGLGKPIFAYMNVPSEEEADMGVRVETYVGVEAGEDGVWRDSHGVQVEDYGLPESLMLWAESRRFYVIVTPDQHLDLTGLRLCLEAVRLYVD